MGKFIIDGGTKLFGSAIIQSSKNAILPMLAASLLNREKVTINNCPKIADVLNMIKILESLGCSVVFEDGKVEIDSSRASGCKITHDLSKALRSSIFLLGSILGRFKYGKVAYPGGCDIGQRPIDFHLKGLKCLSVEITEFGGEIECIGENLQGANIQFDFPSVGATENIMLAAVLAEGKTIIRNAAKEPEIVDLQNFINAMGGNIKGAGSSTIEIVGVEELKKVSYTPIPDRIVAGTLLMAGAMCGGEIELCNCMPEHVYSLIFKLRETACQIELQNDKIYLKVSRRLKCVHMVETAAYPGFPTDLQAQFVSLASISEGTTAIVENIFETRYKHVPELIKMGANITVRDRIAIVRGVQKLTGAEIFAKDLRGGAALVLAGLCADGQTVVNDIYHIDRGYERLDELLTTLSAKIKRVDA